ncbi:MAG: biopolymer transporter ExbD [Betaproteobacteria bacterium]|nr:biopolymer transporter ExbD [Betaproteobacteria bacterium]
MALSIGSDSGDDDEVLAVINTTPLVDVMLVLLIIFLITVPVVLHTVPVALPKFRDQPAQATPQDIDISVDRSGAIYWGNSRLADNKALLARLEAASSRVPQPLIQIRGDQDARYEYVGKVVDACERAGIAHIAFITQPQPHGH